VNNIKLSIPTTIKQGADLRQILRELKTEESYSKKEIIKLRQNIYIQTFEYLKQYKTGKDETEILEEQLTLNNQLEEELEKLKKEAGASTRNLESMQLEKELKQRELIRTAARVRVIKNDNTTKDIDIMDASKQHNETSVRVKEFLALYELVKNERNKYLNQIHSSSQRVTEMKEKIKILSNEIEILRNEISIKDRELAKKKQKNTANFALRDSLRNEANKLMIQYREKRVHIEHCISRIETLNANISSAEEDMLHLKARYEQNVKDRNMAGVHLLDRNDELCILYERINVQQEIMAKGEEALNEKEDDLRRFNILLIEFKRKVELEKQKIPKLTELARKISEEEEKKTLLDLSMTKLGEQMENPDDPKRCRNLGGVDPTQDQLSKKIERLEAFLATQEVEFINAGKNIGERFDFGRSHLFD
jgi:chromosome segregation ATPase